VTDYSIYRSVASFTTRATRTQWRSNAPPPQHTEPGGRRWQGKRQHCSKFASHCNTQTPAQKTRFEERSSEDSTKRDHVGGPLFNQVRESASQVARARATPLYLTHGNQVYGEIIEHRYDAAGTTIPLVLCRYSHGY